MTRKSTLVFLVYLFVRNLQDFRMSSRSSSGLEREDLGTC